MILIGQYDSPFVRRVGIAMRLYGLAFEHRPWSTFADADKIRPHNPLTRVPTLVLADGTALLESGAIIDYLDSLIPADNALFPRQEPARHRALRVASLACGLADKAVSLFYEKRLHADPSASWEQRCTLQMRGVLALLENERRASAHSYWAGNRIGHADVALACALRFLNEAHPGLADMEQFPALGAHAARLEAMPVFQEISQPFIAPA